MLCPLCQSEIKDAAMFCGQCGKKVPRCPTCGNVIQKRVKFCVNDGTRIPDEILDLFPQTPPPVVPVVPVEEEPVVRRFCVRCGGPCEPDQKVCANCRQQEMFDTEPVKKRKKWWIIPLVLLLLLGIGAGAFLIWRGLSDDDDMGNDGPGISSNIDDEDDEDRTTDETLSDDASADAGDEDSTEESTEAPTEAVTEAPTEAPTQPPEVVYESRYELIVSDLSWQDAQRDCEARGGNLVAITSLDEYFEVCDLVEDSGLTYIWLGACIYSDSDEWGTNPWVTGEEWSFDNWYPGEPSKQDEDGTREFCLCMWNVKYDGYEIGWTFNDQRNDLVGSFPSVSGKLGYVCEYKVEVTR